MRPRRVAFAAVAATWLGGVAAAVEAQIVSVDTAGPRIVVRSQAAEVAVRRAKLQFTVRDLATHGPHSVC